MNINQNNQQIEQAKGEGGKLNIPLVVVSIIAITLCILSIVLKIKMDNQKSDYEQRVLTKDTELTKTRETLTEVREEHNVLTQILEKKTNEINELSNILNQTRKELQDTKTLAESKEKARQEAEARIQQLTSEKAELQKQIATLNSSIQELTNTVITLTGERDNLTKYMSELTNSVKNLEIQIADVQKKLANSEGEREFLLKELKRLQAEKAELERQLNDLVFLREQVSKLKAELAVARRLEWIRKGLYGDAKGAELLMTGNKPKPQQPKTNYNIQVEIKTDGTLKVQPGSTNAPQPAPKN